MQYRINNKVPNLTPHLIFRCVERDTIFSRYQHKVMHIILILHITGINLIFSQLGGEKIKSMKVIKNRKREKGGKELRAGNSLEVTSFKESTEQHITGIRERADLANGKGRATNAIR